jgi:hypothetical protein
LLSARVSLRQQPRPGAGGAGEGAPARLLDPAGPAVVLGAAHAALGCVEPLAARADTLFGPRGAALGPLIDGRRALAVCDTGHHRLLLWTPAPRHDHAPADFVIGQPHFEAEGRNGRGAPGPATLNVPTGVALEPGLLVVADAWNHRVLIWHRLPEESNAPADVVLGQADFASVEANRGRREAAADTLHWCYGVSLIGGRLVVADTGNRRVLVWNEVPRRNGCPADLVLGQPAFTRRDQDAGAEAGPLGMRWPHAAAPAGAGLGVADAGNNRVLLWSSWPERSGQPPDAVLGQRGFADVEHNRGAYWPDAASLNMPYGLAADARWLLVADTANSRLLGFQQDQLASGGPAQALAGQAGFQDKGDNRWQAPQRDSVCWPYGLALRDGVAVVADSGNNRVVLWETQA